MLNVRDVQSSLQKRDLLHLHVVYTHGCSARVHAVFCTSRSLFDNMNQRAAKNCVGLFSRW